MEEKITRYEIDVDKREVRLPREGLLLGVEGDSGMRCIYFKMRRNYNGKDLFTFDEMRIDYENTAGRRNYYMIKDATLEDDNIVFTWEIDAFMYPDPGIARFSINLYNHDTKQRFGTAQAEGIVLPRIYADTQITPEEQEDLLNHFRRDIEEHAKKKKTEITELAEEKKEEYNNLAAEKEDAIEKKGADTLATIPEDYTETAKEVKVLTACGFCVSNGKLCVKKKGE